WLDVLDTTLNSDAERMLLQEWCGYLLTGDTSFEKFLWLLGQPASGKGTIVTVIQQLVSMQNIAALDIYNLDKTFSLDGVLGKSLIIFNEGQDSRKRDFSGPIVSRINQITGRDMTRIEEKQKGSVSLVLPTKIMGVSNDMPVFRDASNAINRRLMVLQFDNPVHEDDRDENLKARLIAEENLPGLFNWALDGLIRLRKQRRFTLPESSREIQHELAVAGSPVKAFVNECLILDSDAWTSTTDLYASFTRYSHQHDLFAVDKGIFGKNLRSAVKVQPKQRGPKGNQVRGYVGVSIKPDYVVKDQTDLMLADASK
ncbi:MAG: hypothetical protein KDB27_28520, partial [Planctomycetales bacterium]|nr:hypothetical protein [Planctomycetales bacterium]